MDRNPRTGDGVVVPGVVVALEDVGSPLLLPGEAMSMDDVDG